MQKLGLIFFGLFVLLNVAEAETLKNVILFSDKDTVKMSVQDFKTEGAHVNRFKVDYTLYITNGDQITEVAKGIINGPLKQAGYSPEHFGFDKSLLLSQLPGDNSKKKIYIDYELKFYNLKSAENNSVIAKSYL